MLTAGGQTTRTSAAAAQGPTKALGEPKGPRCTTYPLPLPSPPLPSLGEPTQCPRNPPFLGSPLLSRRANSVPEQPALPWLPSPSSISGIHPCAVGLVLLDSQWHSTTQTASAAGRIMCATAMHLNDRCRCQIYDDDGHRCVHFAALLLALELTLLFLPPYRRHKRHACIAFSSSLLLTHLHPAAAGLPRSSPPFALIISTPREHWKSPHDGRPQAEVAEERKGGLCV